jgi:NAD(P)-dependent dehydrogenase (short-subunit alcohol dehydrogenase family)
MATLSGQTVLVVGGSSGIGFGVAKVALLSLASRVIIASSTPAKVTNAVERLQAVLSESGAVGKALPGTVSGEIVDAKSGDNVRNLMSRVGEIDHLVWTSGDGLAVVLEGAELEKSKGWCNRYLPCGVFRKC